MFRRGFEPRSWAREALEEGIDYSKDRKNFIIWMKERCSTEHADDMVKYLDRYLTTIIPNPRRLFELIGTVEKGKRHFSMGIRDLLKYYETFSLMDEASLIKYRKVVKIPKTNIDNYIPEDEKIVLAFGKVNDERYKILFKLLAFSGIRLREALYLLNHFDTERVILNKEIAKYPLSLERGTKRVFYAYLPKKFADEVKRMDLKEANAEQYVRRRMPPKYLRKWQYNFLIYNGIPESVCDFIQGRAPSTVGSMHYLAKVKQADEWYAKIVPALLTIFPSGAS
jgi:intergrase/recombinase